jgi:hypothetical protein
MGNIGTSTAATQTSRNGLPSEVGFYAEASRIFRDDIGPQTPLRDALRRCGNDTAGVRDDIWEQNDCFASNALVVFENIRNELKTFENCMKTFEN